MNFIYLASPYSDADSAIREYRYREACKAAATIMEHGRAVFAPIAHSHPISNYMAEALRVSHAFWMAQDLPILRYASELWVLTLDGWEMSRGIRRERDYAGSIGLQIKFFSPQELEYFLKRERGDAA